MKQLNLLKTLFLLCALVVGSLNSWAEEVTLAYSGSTTTNMTAGNNASSVGLDEDAWSVIADQGSATNNVGLNKAGNIRLYYHADGSNTLTVSSKNGATINSIVITYVDNSHNNATVTVSGNPASGSNTGTTGSFTIGSSSFTIGNGYTTSNQVQIKSVVISYTPAGGGSSVDQPTFSPAAGAVAAGTKITITQASADAIRYTLDGTNPTKTTGTVYSSPIEITTGTTIKAIAIEGDEVSNIATAIYTISVTAPTFDPYTGTYPIGTTISLTSAGNTIYYTTNGDTPTTSSTEYTDPIVLTESMTVKAIAVDGYGNESAVKSATYTASVPGQVDITPNYTFFGKTESFSGTAYDEVTGTTTEGITVTYTRNGSSLYASSTAMRFYGKNTLKIDAPDDKVITKVVFTQSNATTDDMTSSPTGYTSSNKTFSGNTSSVTFTRTGTSYLQFTKISVTLAAKVSISDAKYATFCDEIARDFSASGITVYAATATSTKVDFDEVTDGIVPANTGVVLYSATTKSDVAIPAATTPSSYDFSSNEMIGVNAKTSIAYAGEGSKKNYILANGASGVGFYKAAAGGANLAAHKAYLSTTAAVTGRDFLGFEDETTGIEKVEAAQQTVGEYYNLAGQRVANPTKGLYIVNGKKVIK